MSTVLYDLVKTQAKITDSVIVAFSGGKESIVVLDLCFRYFKHVQPYYMYICPNLSFQDKMIKWYEDKYDTEIIQILANMTEEFDLDLSEDMGFTDSDIDFMFDGDDRFSQLFETVEGERMRGTLEQIKEARKKLREGAKVMDSIDWYTVIVHENEDARKAFMRDISMPVFEKYITEDQVRRLSNR